MPFVEIDGKMRAVMNYQRASEDDAILLQELTQSENLQYASLKNNGRSDDSIFALLFSADDDDTLPEIRVNIDILTKRQLSALISQRLDTSLQTLTRMNKTDLVKLLLSLGK
ncbi:MAG: hypothetical protein ACRBF0_01105 [Calditrichia bacterium]